MICNTANCGRRQGSPLRSDRSRGKALTAVLAGQMIQLSGQREKELVRPQKKLDAAATWKSTQAVGTGASLARWQEREEASGDCGGAETGRAAAQTLGDRTSLRTVARDFAGGVIPRVPTANLYKAGMEEWRSAIATDGTSLWSQIKLRPSSGDCEKSTGPG